MTTLWRIRALVADSLNGQRKALAFLSAILVAGAVAAAAISPTSAASQEGSSDATAEEGIENAKEAGIAVDPEVEPMMADAPIGSCPNDPTLDGCPKVRAVVYAPEFFSIPKSQQTDFNVPEVAVSSRERRKIIKAKAAFINGRCAVKINQGNPLKSAGYAQAQSQNLCDPAVSDMDLFTMLLKFTNNGGRRRENIQYVDYMPPSRFQKGYVTRRCDNSTSKTWEGRADGYAVYKGVWYGGSNSKFNALNCGTN